MKRVAIILSAYNGQKYLLEQVKSQLNQQYNQNEYELYIYIRDDGSADETLKVIEKFKDYENIVVLKDSGQNVGVRKSFFDLLQQVKADYYFFSDQDDIWENRKVSLFLDKFSQQNEAIPCGVYSDLLVVNADNQSTGSTMMGLNHWKYTEQRNFPFFIFKARVTGAAFAINKRARDLLIKIPEEKIDTIRMHDSIAALLISAYNNLYFIPKALVRYRQHGDNVLGANPRKKKIFEISSRVQGMKKCFNDLQIIATILKNEDIPDENRLAMEIALDFSSTKSVYKRIKNVVKNYQAFWRFIEKKRILFLILFYK